MSVIQYQGSVVWPVGSRRDLTTHEYLFPKTSNILSTESSNQRYQPFTWYTSESNQSVLIQQTSMGNQTTVSRVKKTTGLKERVEEIIDTVIIEKTISSSIDKNLLKIYLLQKFQTIGFEQFQQLSDDIIKNRIEKVVALELLKNLFSDINDEEFDLIKTHAKSEGFFR
jgi:hypothetical protein